MNKIDGTLCTIEFQREALENANTNTEVLKNMGFAAKALEGAHKEIGDIDKVGSQITYVKVSTKYNRIFCCFANISRNVFEDHEKYLFLSLKFETGFCNYLLHHISTRIHDLMTSSPSHTGSRLNGRYIGTTRTS